MESLALPPYDLERFVEAQRAVYNIALEELHSGRKLTHWMWFVFPQLAGLGSSVMARRYALSSAAEARAYWEHPVLGPRLRECTKTLLALESCSATEVMGHPDDLKLKSSMTLFAKAITGARQFSDILQKYFSGEKDPRTLQLLAASGT